MSHLRLPSSWLMPSSSSGKDPQETINALNRGVRSLCRSGRAQMEDLHHWATSGASGNSQNLLSILSILYFAYKDKGDMFFTVNRIINKFKPAVARKSEGVCCWLIGSFVRPRQVNDRRIQTCYHVALHGRSLIFSSSKVWHSEALKPTIVEFYHTGTLKRIINSLLWANMSLASVWKLFNTDFLTVLRFFFFLLH